MHFGGEEDDPGPAHCFTRQLQSGGTAFLDKDKSDETVNIHVLCTAIIANNIVIQSSIKRFKNILPYLLAQMDEGMGNYDLQ